eukprot:9216659-Pyramimonas_sp.AAC.1
MPAAVKICDMLDIITLPPPRTAETANKKIQASTVAIISEKLFDSASNPTSSAPTAAPRSPLHAHATKRKKGHTSRASNTTPR